MVFVKPVSYTGLARQQRSTIKCIYKHIIHRFGQVEEQFIPHEVIDEFDLDNDTMETQQEYGPMPTFENIKSYLASPFVYLNDEIEEEQ